MLVQCGHPHNQFAICIGNELNWLHYMDRTTAECFKAACKITRAIGQPSRQFKMKVGLVVEDAAVSNLKAGRHILSDLQSDDDGWLGLSIECQVHKTAGCFKKMFGLVDNAIRGQIHWALSINYGT
eukprot:4313074-Pyramimonas_sp.AAC.1